MNQFIAAAIQLDSTADKAQNVKNAIGFIQEAVVRGAKYIAMPEQMNYAGPELAGAAEEIPGGPTFTAMAEQAQKYDVWLHCGSIYEKNGESGPPL